MVDITAAPTGDELLSIFTANAVRLLVKPETRIEKMVHCAVGVAGEAGELLDAVKKTWIYNKPLDSTNILEESGDCLFYIARLLQLNGFTLQEAMQANLEKLRKRYPEGYTDQAAQDRADKQ